ncbi:MAG: hypothetical protein GY811_06995, partial [Myxococcales bacterium]|nr:hypothetical protein [Myxococcales bacterium]
MMHEDLIGYLLGALEPHEMRRVAQWLEEDPEARQELEAIERSLRPLEEAYEPPEPPPQDLVAKTLAALPPMPSPDSIGRDPTLGGVGEEAELPESVSRDIVELPKLEPSIDNVRGRGYGWPDALGAAAAPTGQPTATLPAWARGRTSARKPAR